jgi:hypothetical protein
VRVIIEFCGLAATGKSTAVDQACVYLRKKGYKVKKISNLPFVNLCAIGKYKTIKLLYAIMIIVKNIIIRPMIAILLLRCFPSIKANLKYKVIWISTALQYHINWIVERDKLIKLHNRSKSSVIYILDGSPLNLFIEFDGGLIYNKLSSIIFSSYENKNTPTCVVFTITPKDATIKTIKARNRKLEQYLFSDNNLFCFFYDNYQTLLNNFEKKNYSSVKYKIFNINNLLNDLEHCISKYR